MKKLFQKISTWWIFHVMNPVVRKGEMGAFNWVFRRFWLEISTKSGNFRVRFTASEHPYGYLICGDDDDNIIGFCRMLYYAAMTITTDKKLAEDISKAIDDYNGRLALETKVQEDELEEEIAIETEKEIQAHNELPKRARRRVDRDINGRFKKAQNEIKALEENE